MPSSGQIDSEYAAHVATCAPEQDGPDARRSPNWLLAIPLVAGLVVAAAPHAFAGPTPATAVARVAAACSCDAAVAPRAFRACVRRAVAALPRAERSSAAIKSVKRLVAHADCGRTTRPKRTIACCLPYTAGQDIVRDRLCGAERESTCAALGGTAIPGDTACHPNPCAWTASEIPIAHTPPGGYGANFPLPVLTACTEPLVAGAPDLRGMWRVIAVEVNGLPVADHPAYGHFERVEQCGDRLTVTAGGVIHDMRCDGTEANGVHDVAEFDFKTPITVIATYENFVHVLRPVGVPIEVTRKRDGDHMIWKYLAFTARLARIGGPESPPPIIP